MASLVGVGLFGYYIKDRNGFPGRAHLAYLKKHQIQFERTISVDESCNVYVKKWIDKRSFDYCRSSYLDSEKGLVALIGDSHAHAFFPGMAKFSEENGMGTLLLANSSCPPLIGFPWGKDNKRQHECQNKISQIFEILSTNKKISKVIVITRGPAYIHGEVDGEINLENVKRSFTMQNPRNPDTSYANLEEGLLNSFRVISGLPHISQTWYMWENPELDFLPKDVVQRPFDILNVSGQGGTVKRKAYDLRMDKYREIVLSSASQFEVDVLDPTPALCNEIECFSRKGSVFLYADDDHFSVAGSEYIAEFFAQDVFQ